MSLRVIFDRKLYREVVWSFEVNRVLDTNFTFFKSKIHSNWHIFKLTSHLSRLFTVHHSLFFIRYSPLTTHHSRLTTHLSLRVIFGRKLYREVLWSFELNRVLDTNFTFFKRKIHSNWHVFKLTSHLSRLFTVHHSLFFIRYSIFTTHDSLVTSSDFR